MKKIVMIVFISILMLGCVKSHSTLRTDKGFQLYKAPFELISKAVYEEMYKIADDDEFVEAVDGADKGFVITFYKNSLRIQSYVFTVKIVPAKGVDGKGTEIHGYYLNFKGVGSFNYLTSRPTKLQKAIENRLKEEGSPIIVSKMERETFKKTTPNLEEKGIVKRSVESRLKTLNNLFKEGIITDGDYMKKKEELLKEL